MDVHDLPAMEQAAARNARRGMPKVLIKGGHLEGDAVDVRWTDGRAHRIPASRVDTRNTHGTGCVLSAAITVRA